MRETRAACSVNSQSQKLLAKLERKDKRRKGAARGPAGGSDAELAWLLENGMEPLVEADQAGPGGTADTAWCTGLGYSWCMRLDAFDAACSS